MGRLLKYLLYLVVLAGVGLVAFAFLTDLPAPTEPIVVPVTPPAE